MRRIALFLILLCPFLPALEVHETPITFDSERLDLTREYMRQHYGFEPADAAIVPRIIVIHHTAVPTFEASFKRFDPVRLGGERSDIAGGGSLNVSAHYLVDRDGSVHRLMDETRMARHVIGLNHCSIGIENVGGATPDDTLSAEQLEADRALIADLIERYEGIEYLIGHYEYRCFEAHPLWAELDARYRTVKHDPDPEFMHRLRALFPQLKAAPCHD